MDDVRSPKYYGLKQHLLALAGDLEPGAAVPSERELAERFATSRTTVRQALAELVGEGRLERRHGKGTFVARPKIVQPLVLFSFSEDLAGSGRSPSSVLLGFEPDHVDPEAAAALGLPPDAPLLLLERLRSVDGEPMAVERTCLPGGRFGDLSAADLDGGSSLYRLLRDRHGVEVVEATETIETGSASPGDARLLAVGTGLPVLLMGRLAFDARGRAVERTRAVFRGDRLRLVARLTRPPADDGRNIPRGV